MNCWFWVWFLHFSGRKSLRNLFQPAERGVVLSRNQIAAIGLPESWVNCLAEAAEPHWWQEFLPSNRWFSSCSARVMWKLAMLEKCWNPTRETNGKGRKNPTPQDFPLQKSHEPKRRPAFFPMAPALLDAWIESECISRCLNSCLKSKKTGNDHVLSATVPLDCRIRFNGSMENFQKLGSQPNLNCQTSIRFYPWTLSCWWVGRNCENLSIDFSVRSDFQHERTRFPSFFWIHPNT